MEELKKLEKNHLFIKKPKLVKDILSFIEKVQKYCLKCPINKLDNSFSDNTKLLQQSVNELKVFFNRPIKWEELLE